jgi:hypothetical protein
MGKGRNVIKIAFIGDASSVGKAANQAAKSAGGVKKGFSGVGDKIKGAFSVVGIGASVAFLGTAVNSAIQGEAAQAKLARSLQQSAGATKAQVAEVNKYITKTSMATGVTKGELRPALISLVTATKNVGQSQKLLGLAMDISARTGKPLAQVSLALGRAYNGNTTALGKLGLKVKTTVKDTAAITKAQKAAGDAQLLYVAAVKKYGPNSDKARKAALNYMLSVNKVKEAQAKTKTTAKSFNDIQKELNKTFGGSAAAAAQTTEGKMKRLKVQFAAVQAKIGAELLPVINKLTDVFLKHQGIVLALVGALAGFVVISKITGFVKNGIAAFNVLKSALVTTTVAEDGLNVSMAANPIGIVVIAIAALVAGFILAYTKLSGSIRR